MQQIIRVHREFLHLRNWKIVKCSNKNSLKKKLKWEASEFSSFFAFWGELSKSLGQWEVGRCGEFHYDSGERREWKGEGGRSRDERREELLRKRRRKGRRTEGAIIILCDSLAREKRRGKMFMLASLQGKGCLLPSYYSRTWEFQVYCCHTINITLSTGLSYSFYIPGNDNSIPAHVPPLFV